MPKKPDPAAELAAKMIHALQELRGQGGGAYPTTIARLRELADPSASPELTIKASGKQPFSGGTFAAKKKNLAAPVVLKEDEELLAANPRTLEFALETLYASDPPPWPIKKLSAKLEMVLRVPFEATVGRQVAEDALPESVAVLRVGRKPPALYFKSRPPPPPPPPPHKELSERLVKVLEAQRRLGADSYSVRLKRLLELTGMPGAAKLLTKARKEAPFVADAVQLVPKHPDSPVVLAVDVEEAAGRPALLDFLLEMKRAGAARAFSAADLKAALDKRAQTPFADGVARRTESGTLPDGVGWIDFGIGKKTVRLLFRLQDVHAGRPVAAPPPVAAAEAPASSADFDAAFDAAFARLDRARGSYNSVSLVDLRRALPFDRAAFDAHLRRLRASRRYGLSAAEGRDGLGPDQRAAGIMEEGNLLLFVSRREP